MSCHTKDVLVLGGTGAMGAFLVDRLSVDGYKLYVTSRKKYKDTKTIVYIQGNAHSDSFLKEILDRHYDAIVDFMYYEVEAFNKRIKMLLDATDQYFFISSSRVYANSDIPLTEESDRLWDVQRDAPFLPSTDYAAVKAQEEDLLMKYPRRNWTIIRPYMTYYHNRLDLGYFPKELWLYRIIKGRTVILPKSIVDKKTTLTYGNDVAEGIKSLLGKGSALGKAFHITIDKSYTWKDIFVIYKQAIEKKGYIVKYKEMELPGDAEECIYRYDRKYNRLFDNAKIKEYLNTEHFIDPKEGISLCVEKFLQHPCFLNINWAQQAYWDRLLGEQTNLGEIDGVKSRIIYLFYRFMLPYSTIRHTYRLFKRIVKK